MFAGAELVGIHGQTHGAPRRTPVKAGIHEDLRQTFFFSLGLNEPRAGYNQRLFNGLRDTLTFKYRGRSAQVFDPRVWCTSR